MLALSERCEMCISGCGKSRYQSRFLWGTRRVSGEVVYVFGPD